MKRKRFVQICFVGGALLLAGGLAWTAPRQPQQSAADGAKEIVLLGPNGVRPSIEQMAADFEAQTGYKIKGSYGSSGAIKKRVIDGEAFDVAILLAPIADAFPSGNLDQGSIKPLGSMAIVIAGKKGAPKPDISTPDTLKAALLESKAISYSHGAVGALSGILVDDAFTQLGILDLMLPKIKPGGLGAVVRGDVDYALAFQPEANDPGVDIIGPLPAAISTPAPMVGALSSHTKNPDIAKALLDYLATPAAKAIYKSKGIGPVS